MNNRKLTEGSIFKNLMLFALPMMVGNFLQQIYNIADTIIVGRFVSSDALAAVGAEYPYVLHVYWRSDNHNLYDYFSGNRFYPEDTRYP